jgi:hypothetical protein
LAEAEIVFTGDSGRIILRTDPEGHFRLPLVQPGVYTAALTARPSTAGAATDAALIWIEVSSGSASEQTIEISDHP